MTNKASPLNTTDSVLLAVIKTEGITLPSLCVLQMLLIMNFLNFLPQACLLKLFWYMLVSSLQKLFLGQPLSVLAIDVLNGYFLTK